MSAAAQSLHRAATSVEVIICKILGYYLCTGFVAVHELSLVHGARWLLFIVPPQRSLRNTEALTSPDKVTG